MNRSKSTKGNPGLSGVHLFRTLHPAVYLLPAGRRRSGWAVLRPAPAGWQRGSWMDVHPGSRTLRGLWIFQVPWYDCRKSSLGLVQVGIPVS